MIILVDMDNVLVDFDGGFHEVWERQGNRVLPRTSVRLEGDYGDVSHIIRAPGFVRGLRPVPGALEAVSELSRNHEVFICSSPLHPVHQSSREKLEWVAEHLGEEWLRRVILTKDKTLVKGDILIDDKPEITGAVQPEWEHVVFDQPYNRHVQGRRINWQDWRQLL